MKILLLFLVACPVFADDYVFVCEDADNRTTIVTASDINEAQKESGMNCYLKVDEL